MPVNNEQLLIIKNMLTGMSAENRQKLSTVSTKDLSSAVAGLITGERGQSMGQTIAALVTGSVSNWTALEAALSVADGATIYTAIAEFTAALEDHDEHAMISSAVAVALASKKHLGV